VAAGMFLPLTSSRATPQSSISPPPWGPNPSPQRGRWENAATATTTLRIPPAEPPRVCRASPPQHADPDQSSHHTKAGRAESRRSRADPRASHQPRAKGPAAKPRGPGQWPRAGSAEPFPKARLKRNARFICLFIYLSLTGKCNTKANYLIEALGSVLMSQASKQLSKPLFCLQQQSGGRNVGAGRGGTGPLSCAAAARPATARGGSARGQAR